MRIPGTRPTLPSLPTEVLQGIATELPPSDVLALRATSRRCAEALAPATFFGPYARSHGLWEPQQRFDTPRRQWGAMRCLRIEELLGPSPRVAPALARLDVRRGQV